MRTIVLAMVAAMAATTASAMDLGNGLSLNTEVKAFRLVDAETNNVTVEPELRYTTGALSLFGEVPLTVYETNHASGDDFAIQNITEDGYKPVLEFGAEYNINEMTQVYGETTWDLNTEDRGEVEVGVTFNF